MLVWLPSTFRFSLWANFPDSSSWTKLLWIIAMAKWELRCFTQRWPCGGSVFWKFPCATYSATLFHLSSSAHPNANWGSCWDVTDGVVWVSGAELALQRLMLWCMVAPNDRPSVKKFLRWSVCRRSCWELLLVVQLLQSKLNEDFIETLMLELHRQKKKKKKIWLLLFFQFENKWSDFSKLWFFTRIAISKH